MLKFYLYSFFILVAALIVDAGFSYVLLYDLFIKSMTSIFLVSIIVITIVRLGFSFKLIPYLLFFSVSVFSLLGFIKIMNGSHSGSTNILLYGLSFYTASLAYLYTKQQISYTSILSVSNPLFLASGPVLVHIKNINYRSFNLRFKYFYPYLVLGFFLYQFVSIPLIKTFFLIENMDALSTLIFAIIFELFVYANFAGLSLMIYAIAGFLGYRIPLNFRQPFSATNIIDFWKGWHISLSMTLKAIFYDPARKTLGSSAAILIVFISSAMWHGVSLNFLIWGVFHALIFISTIWLLKRNIKFMPFIVFILAIVIGRLVFLDSDFDRLLTKLHFNYEGTLVFNELLLLPKTTVLSIFVMILFVFFEFLFRKKPSFVKRNYKFYRTNLMAFLLLFITLSSVAVDSGVGYAVYGQR